MPTHKYGMPDDENPEWTAEDWANARPGREVLPTAFVREVETQQRRRGRGPRKVPTKRRGAEPVHPGEILLQEFLKCYDPPVSQVDAAARMHIPMVRLNQLIRGHRGVSPDMALRLADLTGTTAEFWLNLQNRYDLWHAQQVRIERRDPKIRSLAKAN